MADPITLSALGFVANQVLGTILEMRERAVTFPENLEQLKDTLERVIPLFVEGSELDLELNGRPWNGLGKLIEKLGKGEDLVRECCEVPSWNIYLKIRNSKRIINLDKAIKRFCQRELPVEIWHGIIQLRRDAQLQRNTDQERNANVGVPSIGYEGLFAVPELPDHVVGFDIPLKELKNELFKDNVKVLGLFAPGGRGKSTLAAMLCRDEEVKGTFKNIFFLTISRTPTLTILRRLLEKIIGDKPASDLSEEDATKQFRFLLEQRKPEPLLLVLDDVRDESIIEKLFYRTEGYKMLITSTEPFKRYNLIYHSKYLLKTLSHQDSMTLFCSTVLFQDENEDSKPDEDILNKIVKCCNGFPLAIVVIAKSLSLQPKWKWNTVARKLSNGSSILDIDKRLLECLATSLDSLDDTVLECFLDLGSFPKDERIPASALIDIWCEFYELEYEGEAYVNLFELASRNLVNLVGSRKFAEEMDGSYNELFVTKHDLLRKLAIYRSGQQSKRLIMDKREKGLPESWRKQENPYLNARLVSLHTGEMQAESWYDLQLPEAEVLILNLSASNYALPPFLERMRKLKVLIVVNHGRTHAKLSNLNILGKLANLKRIRLEKVSIPSLHEFTMPLVHLRKISLVMCEVGQALKQCNINVSDMLPSLVEVNIDYCNDLKELPSWICDIKDLQILSITNCHELSTLPEEIGCMTDLDLLRLHACTGLSKLPDSLRGLQKLGFLDISDCSTLEQLPDGMDELCRLNKLDMRGCIKLRKLPPSAMNLVYLEEVICDEDTACLWEPRSSNLKITVLKKEITLDFLRIDINTLLGLNPGGG